MRRPGKGRSPPPGRSGACRAVRTRWASRSAGPRPAPTPSTGPSGVRGDGLARVAGRPRVGVVVGEGDPGRAERRQQRLDVRRHRGAVDDQHRRPAVPRGEGEPRDLGEVVTTPTLHDLPVPEVGRGRRGGRADQWRRRARHTAARCGCPAGPARGRARGLRRAGGCRGAGPSWCRGGGRQVRPTRRRPRSPPRGAPATPRVSPRSAASHGPWPGRGRPRHGHLVGARGARRADPWPHGSRPTSRLGTRTTCTPWQPRRSPRRPQPRPSAVRCAAGLGSSWLPS